MNQVQYPIARPAALITDEQIAADEITQNRATMETLSLSNYQLDYETVFATLDDAESRLTAGLAASSNQRLLRRQEETRLGLELDRLTTHLPDRIVFDRRFWLYITKHRPGWVTRRYAVRKEKEREDGAVEWSAVSQGRVRGRPSRQALAAATLIPRLLRRLEMDPCAIYPKLGARTRMWILDEVPLSPRLLMRGFIQRVSDASVGGGQDAYLDAFWPQMAIRTGGIVVEFLNCEEVENLLDACHAAI